MMQLMRYRIRHAGARPDLSGDWAGAAWRQADTLDVAYFRPESSDHRPRTSARMLYASDGLYGIFRVEDRYVRCTHTGAMGQVWKDSCVEFFVQPRPGERYLNFEFNCGGSMFCSNIVRAANGSETAERLSESQASQVKIYHSLPDRVDPEIDGPVEWRLEFFIPFALLEQSTGLLGCVPGQEWRANFYKCADQSSHPHWAAWSPVDELNFHLPRCFGSILFEPV